MSAASTWTADQLEHAARFRGRLDTKAELLTQLGEALGAAPTPYKAPPLPERLFYSGPPLVDDDDYVWAPERDYSLPDQDKLDRETRVERYRYFDAVAKFTGRFSKEAKARIRARRKARQQRKAASA